MSQQTGIFRDRAAHGARTRSARPARQAPTSLKRVTSGASLVVGGALVWQASNFAFNAIGAHALGPGRYGVLAASLALLSLAAPLLAAVQAVASREATSLVAKGEIGTAAPMLRHYGFRVTCGALALGGVAAAASRWVSSLFHLGSPWLVVIAGAAVPCYMVSHLLGGLLQGAERFGRFGLESAVEGSAKAVFGALAMGVMWRSALSGMVAVFASCVAGLMTYLLLTLPLLRKDPLSPPASPGSAAVRTRIAHRPHRAGESRGVARYSVTALVTYGLLALMLSSDTLIARHYLPSHQAGLYAGISLAGKISYFAAASLYVVAFPIFSRHDDQGAGSGRWMLATGGLVCAITAAIVAFFTFEPAWVVIPLLGGRYQAAEGYVPWMAAVFGLYSLGFLVSIYLLARKRRSIIALLAVAVTVQFACFFAFHSTITKMMGGLATAFGVLLAGGVCLAAAGGGRGTRTPARGSVPRQAQLPWASAPGMPAGTVPAQRSPAPAGWKEKIVAEVTRQAGPAPVLLAGSRALGTAHPHSDYDIAVVLPLLRIPRAVPRLAAASERLSAHFGVRVSVNPVPGFRMRRPGGSLFVRKLQAEAVVLAAPRGWSLPRQPLTGVTRLGACSVLLSAVQSLLENFDTSAMRALRAPSQASLALRQAALRKAALHVAQVRLLRQGLYAPDLQTALARLRSTPVSGNGGMSGAALSAELSSGLAAADPVGGFVRMRACILGQLAEIADVPLRRPAGESLARNAQYAALAAIRGRSRWRSALRGVPVEAALASAQLALLRALDPRSADGVDAGLLRLAAAALPVPAARPGEHTWEGVRDLVLAEWPDAHPLVGLLA